MRCVSSSTSSSHEDPGLEPRLSEPEREREQWPRSPRLPLDGSMHHKTEIKIAVWHTNMAHRTSMNIHDKQPFGSLLELKVIGVAVMIDSRSDAHILSSAAIALVVADMITPGRTL